MPTVSSLSCRPRFLLSSYDTDARRELLTEGLSIALPVDLQVTKRRIDQAFDVKPVPFKLKALPVLWSGMGLLFAFNAGDDLRLLLTDSAGPLTIAGFISSLIGAPLSLFNARNCYKQRIVTEMHDTLIAPMFKLAARETEPAEQGSGSDSRKLEEVSELMQLTLHPLSHIPMDEDDLAAINENCPKILDLLDSVDPKLAARAFLAED